MNDHRGGKDEGEYVCVLREGEVFILAFISISLYLVAFHISCVCIPYIDICILCSICNIYW